MRLRWLRVAAPFVVLLAAVLPPSPSVAQHELPLDHTAVFKTHVPHVNSQIGMGQGGGAQATLPTPTATFSGLPYGVGATVTPTNTVPEAEQHIAVDPNNSSTLVTAVSDFDLAGGGYNTTKYAVSFDNGATWAGSYLPMDPFGLGFLATGDGFFWLANSDPTIAIDKLGNVYMANLYLDVTDNGNGLYVSVVNLSAPKPITFTAEATYPVATNPSASTRIQEDKPWVTVDNSSNPSTMGNVYVCWSRFTRRSDTIVFSRSIDHGLTWTSPLRISPKGQDGAVQGCQAAVGPNGEVYVAYEVFFVSARRQHFLAKSVDGGLTFSTPHAITPVFNEINFSSTYRKNSFTSLTVSPSNGHVYAIYAAQQGTLGAEVQFIASTDGGATFSLPVTINDGSTGQQFFPAIATDSNGVIHVTWFDTRNSDGSSARYDIYATYSKDNGATFAPNARVTGVLIDAGTASFIGDYTGIAAAAGSAHPVWTSGGFNNGSLQTAVLQLLP